jgi:hypothetical protein
MTKTELVAPVVAIGDVHGCASLLDEVLEQHRGSGADLIFLGDLIDRSPQTGGDRKVLERVVELRMCRANSLLQQTTYRLSYGKTELRGTSGA